MTFVIGALTFVGVLCVLNLVFTFGVVRRLREHSELLSGKSQSVTAPGQAMLPVGETPSEFAVTTVDGQTVSRSEISGTTLLGFFSPECSLCRQYAPAFAAHVAELPEKERRALAVVVGREDETRDLVESLGDVVQVVRELTGGAVSSAYDVRAFPCLGIVTDGGTVVESDLTIDRLRDIAAV
ncbi:redoxin domain-containing protein [Streptosporangium sp. KLBMP 9127]|nr:peroxiredoxin family protein [Streptosporangium sp. KLBMP 9127]